MGGVFTLALQKGAAHGSHSAGGLGWGWGGYFPLSAGRETADRVVRGATRLFVERYGSPALLLGLGAIVKGSRSLSDSEIKLITDALGRTRSSIRNRAIFVLGLKTGFRIKELLSLRVGDVLQNGSFVDRISVDRKNMKKKREGRTVILHPEAAEALRTLVTELQSKGYASPGSPLFRSRSGKDRPLSRVSAWEMLKNTFASCGLTGKLGTHCMRKTFAKKVHAKLGKDLIRTQKALGHASVNSTVSYLSFADEEIDDAILKS